MTTKEIIELALHYRANFSLNELLDNYNLEIKHTDFFNHFQAFTIDNFILINTNTPYYNFILSHEIAHYLLHHKETRIFNNAINFTDRLETQANLFATVYCLYSYNFYNTNPIQKIINDIWARFSNELSQIVIDEDFID